LLLILLNPVFSKAITRVMFARMNLMISAPPMPLSRQVSFDVDGPVLKTTGKGSKLKHPMPSGDALG
jgi:hypothetical protein